MTLKRIRYQAKARGLKELCVLLENLNDLPVHYLPLLDSFLKEDDNDILDWLLQIKPLQNPRYKELLEVLRDLKHCVENDKELFCDL